MNIEGVINALDEIKIDLFKIPTKWNVTPKGDGILIQIRMKIKCNETKEECWQHGGKHYISSHSMKDEVVMRAWKAFKDFIAHEVHEAFYYRDEQIFQPHYSVDELVQFRRTAEAVKRPDNRIASNAQDIDI